MPIQRKVNKDFFKAWSPDMAYVLGFFVADGSMYETKRGTRYFDFTSTDRVIIEQIRDALGSSHRIGLRPGTGEWNDIYHLQIGSKEMFADLLALGMMPKKTRDLKLPEVPSQYFGDFVRGYFDGDGNVYCKKHFVKARGKKRWVFRSRFTSADKRFLTSLHDRFLEGEINRGFINTNGDSYILVLSHHDSLALFRLMYNNSDCSILLRRKLEIFERAFIEMYDGQIEKAGVAQPG